MKMKGVLRIPQSPSITWTSLLDCLVSYPGGGSYPSAEKQSVYYTAPADWAKRMIEFSAKAKDKVDILQNQPPKPTNQPPKQTNQPTKPHLL